MSALWLSALSGTDMLPIFIVVGVVAVLVFLAIIFLNYSRKSNPENDLLEHITDRVLLLLLLVAVFTLGAFLMYVLLI
jgi:nitrate reductase gamma subunit